MAGGYSGHRTALESLRFVRTVVKAEQRKYSLWARLNGWDGVCKVCGHNWKGKCHGDCTCLACNAERQEMERDLIDGVPIE